MPLTETILAFWGTAAGTASLAKDLRDVLKEQVRLEDVLAQLVENHFRQHLPRLQHLCRDGQPTLNSASFSSRLTALDLQVTTVDELTTALLPVLQEEVSLPGMPYDERDCLPVYKSILNAAIRGLWKEISNFGALSSETIMEQNEIIIQSHTSLAADVDVIKASLSSLAEFARGVWTQSYDQLVDSAPPAHHTIDAETFANPFLLARAEDFNHNYEKLARLFQDSPEWDSIQRRTDNVFIEGGRGTGKSMLLRRLTAQATVAAYRLANRHATFDDLPADYFGVYVKLTRGYYDQFTTVRLPSDGVASLLAQHELNVEIFDAFVDTLRWLFREQALPILRDNAQEIVTALGALFPKSPAARSLEDLQRITVRFEQDQIITYYRERAFDREVSYQGSALDTVTFVRRLSQLFRTHLFPKREVRLFILIDEFETLGLLQQVALNTVIKMRLPDISAKIAVRRSGRKTSDTFTPDDPIQDPRDYTPVPLDYDIIAPQYRELLAGIAAKRLQDAGYPETQIQSYLRPKSGPEVPPERLDAELHRLWSSGQRRNDSMNDEFEKKYEVAATYRVIAEMNTRKSFSGFEQYSTLSSGIVSNFIELCKYAFYFALSDQLPLKQRPTIPSYLQSEAVYRVSQRLLATIDGNVPKVGPALAQLLSDLGSILRQRLLSHPSEPEANRLSIDDYSLLAKPRYEFLARVVDGAIVWSVFHIQNPEESFRPKNSARPPSAELIINRIYCPALGISPRSRWRVSIKTADLDGLINPTERSLTYQRLMRAIGDDKSSAELQGKLWEDTPNG